MNFTKWLLAFFCIISSTGILSAQHEWDTWYFGYGAGLDFRTNPPTVLDDGKVFIQEGCASFCDRLTGDILFYTDGSNVWNRNHDIMVNGTGLKGSYSSAQAAIIVSHPSEPNHFYIFTSDHSASQGGGYYYNEIDLNLDNGLGAVISGRKNILLYAPSSEKITIVNIVMVEIFG